MEYELGTYLKVSHSIEIGAIVGVLLVDEDRVGIYLSLDLVLVQEEVVEGREEEEVHSNFLHFSGK